MNNPGITAKSTIPTPRTDEQVRKTHQGVSKIETVQADFARLLEQELYGATKYLNQSGDNEERLMNERDGLREEASRLRKALEHWQHVWKETDCEHDDCTGAYDEAVKALETQP